MKKFITIVFLIFGYSYLVAQTPFTDGFETGDFSKWDNNVGAVISNAYHHTGNYSAKFDVSSAFPEKTITKNNTLSTYIKMDFYAYVTSFAQNLSALSAGGNGLLWFFGIYTQSSGYMYNCSHQQVSSSYNLYFQMNYWNHIVIERSSTGYLYVWINGSQFVDGALVGSCSFNDISFSAYCWYNPLYGYMTAYLDDITLYYVPVGITHISSEVPSKYNLSQNYPNPFNPTTNIKFDIPKNEFATMKVYDMLGKEITTLVNEKLNAGTYSVDWNASEYPSGVYFYRLQTDSYTEVKKMILTK